MPKRSSNHPRDLNALAARIVHEAVDDVQEPAPKSEMSMYAQELGRRGGLKGGKARASKLSPARRSEIAKKAARARWDKRERS